MPHITTYAGAAYLKSQRNKPVASINVAPVFGFSGCIQRFILLDVTVIITEAVLLIMEQVRRTSRQKTSK